MAPITIAMLPLGITLRGALRVFPLRRKRVPPGAFLPLGMTLAVLVAALLHFVVTPRIVAAWAVERARQELLAVPVYDVLRRHEPAVFARLLAGYARVVRDPAYIDTYTQ